MTTTIYIAIRGSCFEGASCTDKSARVIVEDFDNPDFDGNTQLYEDGVGELEGETLQELLERCKKDC